MVSITIYGREENFFINGTIHDVSQGDLLWRRSSGGTTHDAPQIKALGRQVSNYDEHIWNGIRQIVVYEGLLAKFSQNEDLKDKLKSTGEAMLAECALKDLIWSVGLSMKDPDRFDKTKWKGKNLLGYTLMMVRERL